jgi:CHAD domain-containing protein
MGKARPPTPATPPPSLAQALDQRVEDLRTLVRTALRTWDVEAVHHARVTTRRLKAAVDLLRPLLPDAPAAEFARALRKLRRTLGPLRDLDVMLQHLAEMKVPPGRAAAAEWVARRLEQQRADLRRKAARKLTPRKALGKLGAWVDLEHEVHDANAAAGPLLARVAPQQVRDFAARADHHAARKAPNPDAPDDVHELRVAGKLLRYTLELAEPLGMKVPRSVAKEFKALQEELGLWHDYVVLAEQRLALAVEDGLAARRPDLFGQVMDLARTCWQRGQRHLDKFRVLWGQTGPDLAARAAGAFDPTPAAPAPTAPDDPPGPNGQDTSDAENIPPLPGTQGRGPG